MSNNTNQEIYKDMYNRVKNNITYTYRDQRTNKYVQGHHNETNLAKLTTACLDNNLVPEKNHIVMIKDKVYITWEGTKWILKQKGIYWEVNECKFSYNEEGDVRCQIKLIYLPDLYGYKDSMKTYLQFVNESLEKNIPISDINKLLMPNSVGVGMYRMKEAESSGRLSDMETMALKRAIFTALNYSQVIDGSIDTLEYGNNIPNEEHDSVSKSSGDKAIKPSPKKKKETYSELSIESIDVDMSDQEEVIINEAFGKKSKEELNEAEKNKLVVWIRNLSKINKEEMLYVLQYQLEIYSALTTNPEIQEYFMELLKMYDLKSLFAIRDRKTAETISKAIIEKLS